MYRLMLYFLTVLLVVAIIYCFVGILPYNPWDIILAWVVLIFACWTTNKFLAYLFKVPTNLESDYITGFILTLIFTQSLYTGGNPFDALKNLVIVAVLSQLSKYILVYRGKHIFNPAGIAVLISFYLIDVGASWWIGGAYILPFVLIGGLLVTRKIQRFDLVLAFLISALTAFAFDNRNGDILASIQTLVINSSLLFFTFVMLTEPLTTPPTRKLRIVYGVLVGLLYGTYFIIGDRIVATPELALIVGNVFSFIVSSKGRFRLMLKSKSKIAEGIYNFSFESNHKVKFKPGQYMEWTVADAMPDSRGNRRYFTIASSPTEPNVNLGVKFYEHPSSFKTKLHELNPGGRILAGQQAGDFTMPNDKNRKLAFIAGGIGITPFRSMIKYLIDTDEKRDVVLFYSVKNESEIAYREVFMEAQNKLGSKIVFIETDKMGFLTPQIIREHAGDYKQRLFYISGPRGMVTAFEKTLSAMGVGQMQIRVDFFPGYV
ncbi:MAG: RnfABCDGE type electron transport complex subunit D [Candidatus Doudnabacteria bacterium]|nr:RnfABCDGE type electron transport complex subunit D [Candidatus Doudnabacteria bacterium]